MKITIFICGFLILWMFAPQKIQANEQNEIIETAVLQSTIMLTLSSQKNNIEIENEFLSVKTDFEIYYLESAAIAMDMLIFKSEDERIVYLSYDFTNQTLYYTIKIDTNIYYSNTPLGYENVDIDIFNEEIMDYFIVESSISSYDNAGLYNSFLESIYSNYKYHYSNENINTNTYSTEYSFTGKPQAIEKGEELINYFFSPNLLSTVGLHTGNCYDMNGNIRYFYAINTEDHGGSMPFLSLIKVWEVDFYVLNNGTNQNQKLIRFNVINYVDVYIRGGETSGEIAIADEGVTYWGGQKQINSSVEVNGYSYINQFSVNYTEKKGSTSVYLTKLDEILGNFVPFYEIGKTVVNGIGNILINISSYSFNNTIKSYEFNNIEDGNNLKSAGFEIRKGLLHRYDFYQTCLVDGLPDYNTNFSFKIKFAFMAGFNVIFSESIQMEKSICSHAYSATKVGSELSIHKIKCTTCNSYYYKEHVFVGTTAHISICQCGETLENGHTFTDFRFINPSVHSAICKCGYNGNESHEKYYSGGKCWACNYKGPIFLPTLLEVKNKNENNDCTYNT